MRSRGGLEGKARAPAANTAGACPALVLLPETPTCTALQTAPRPSFPLRRVKEVMREASFLYAELVKVRGAGCHEGHEALQACWRSPTLMAPTCSGHAMPLFRPSPALTSALPRLLALARMQMGAAMSYIDCGGGLAVDYDGSFTDSAASMAYTLQHYANDGEESKDEGSGTASLGVCSNQSERTARPGALPLLAPPPLHLCAPPCTSPDLPLPGRPPRAAVVSAVQEVCIQRSIAPPTIITESGRALASHHSVLVFDVLTT